MADIILFPGVKRPAPARSSPTRGGNFYPVRLADGLWHIDHMTEGGSSYGLTNLGLFKTEAEAEQVASELNALAWHALQTARCFPPGGGGSAA